MPLTNFPGGLASFGVPLLGGGPVFTTGNVFFVDSGSSNKADDPSHGKAPDKPFATIDYAVGKCTANNGDHIIVMPGHTETVSAAAGLVFDVAGVTVVGIGHGSARPTVDFTTATGADMDVTAANVRILNVLFTGGVDALTNPIHIAAADCELGWVETKDVTGQATDFIVTTTAADRLYIHDWVHRGSGSAGAETAISIVGGDGIRIEDFWIDGNFGTAAIENVTTAATNITICGRVGPSYIRTRNAADVAVTLVATATGNVGPNVYARLADDAANVTEAFVGADAQFFQPIAIVNADGESSMQTNITATTDA